MAVIVTFTSLLLLFFLHPLLAQVITGSFGPPDPPARDPSPLPLNQTVRLSFPPRGRSDVPVRRPMWEKSLTPQMPPTEAIVDSTKELSEGQRLPDPTMHSFSISTLSSMNLSSRPVRARPTGSRPRTDTASMALSRASSTGEAWTKGPHPPVISTPFNEVIDSAGLEPVKDGRVWNRTGRGPQGRNKDGKEVGSVSSPTTLLFRGEPHVSLATVGNEGTQFWPEAQSTAVGGLSPENADVKPLPVANQTEEPRPLPLTTRTSISTTPSPKFRVKLPPTLKPTSSQTGTLAGDAKV